MHKKFHEKVRDYFIKLGKDYRILLPLAAVGLLLTLLLTRFCTYCKNGTKRFASVFFIVGCFLIGNSFAFPTFIMEDGFVSEDVGEETIAASDSALKLSDNLTEYTLDEPEISVIFEDEEYGEDIEAELLGDIYSLEDILADVSETPRIENAQAPEDTLSFSADDWRLTLVNKQHPISDDYSFELGKLSGNMQCDQRIIEDLLLMMQAASDDGVSLVICSPYRDLNKQEILFERKINLYMQSGYSYIDAYRAASMIVTVPGASEHQIGLALDLISKDYVTLDEGFEDTDAGKWLYANCAQYGFVLRYPKGKEYITSIEYEPWHFRYVGREAAKVIMEENLCLEEFWEKYL